MTRPRSPGNQFLRWFGEVANPVYAVDGRRCLLYANAATESWLGIDASQICGLRCDYHSPVEAGNEPLSPMAAALCPAPEAFHGELTRRRLTVKTVSGVVSRRISDQFPLHSPTGAIHGVLVFVAAVESPEREFEESWADGEAFESAIRVHDQLREARLGFWAPYQVECLLGESPEIARVRELARWTATSGCRVVVRGRPGAGREFLTRAIHRGFRPLSEPLVAWDGALLDGDLMGRAIDTLARLTRPGREPATPSLRDSLEKPDVPAWPTVLLKDVDRLPVDAQGVLWEAIEAGRLECRTLATAEHSLLAMGREGRFRRDLAAWLSTCELELPPLSSRPQDVALLAQSELERWNAQGRPRQLGGFTADALQCLGAYPWPGEWRELRRLVAEACERSAGPLVTATDLPMVLRQAADASRRPRRPAEQVPLDAFLRDIERELIARALRESRGNKAKAARLLAISRPRLLRSIKELGLANDP
jgi:DNA-binding NtrC family response regulator